MGFGSPRHNSVAVHGVCLLALLALLFGPVRASGQDKRAPATNSTESQAPEAMAPPSQTAAENTGTRPQVEQGLPSYEGQNVASVELAGQPNLDAQQLLPLLAQQAN